MSRKRPSKQDDQVLRRFISENNDDFSEPLKEIMYDLNLTKEQASQVRFLRSKESWTLQEEERLIESFNNE